MFGDDYNAEDMAKARHDAALAAAIKVRGWIVAQVRNAGSSSMQWMADGWEQMNDHQLCLVIGDTTAGSERGAHSPDERPVYPSRGLKHDGFASPPEADTVSRATIEEVSGVSAPGSAQAAELPRPSPDEPNSAFWYMVGNQQGQQAERARAAKIVKDTLDYALAVEPGDIGLDTHPGSDYDNVIQAARAYLAEAEPATRKEGEPKVEENVCARRGCGNQLGPGRWLNTIDGRRLLFCDYECSNAYLIAKGRADAFEEAAKICDKAADSWAQVVGMSSAYYDMGAAIRAHAAQREGEKR